ncbi:MAG TPA: sulfite exporter TauE/SafE family protein [Burkholderiaceae bacterium]
MITAALMILLAGLAIGATGIGGILVVPVLTGLAGQSMLEAVAASSCAFLFTGIVAFWRQRRSAESIPWAVYGATFAGAVAGAMLTQWLPAAVLRGAVAVLAIVSGVHAWATLNASRPERSLPRTTALAGLGLFVGAGSAVSGTGGPVLILPLLMLLGVPLRSAISLAQGVQLPVAIAASGVYAIAGRLDVRLAVGLGVLLMAGSWLGYRLAEVVPSVGLKRVVAVGLIATGVAYGWNSL